MKYLQSLLLQKINSDLANSLSEYGLQPKDWILKKSNTNFYLIKNKTEPDFYFIGTTELKKGREMWKSISLKSV